MRILLAALVLTSFANDALARQKSKRLDLMEQLGLEKAPPKAAGDNEDIAPDDNNSDNDKAAEASGDEAAPAPPPEARRVRGPTIFFNPHVKQVLTTHCQSCHDAKKMPRTGFPITGDDEKDYAMVRRLTAQKSPDKSRLLVASRGERHMGGKILAAESAAYTTMLQWISAGTPLTRAASPAAQPTEKQGASKANEQLAEDTTAGQTGAPQEDAEHASKPVLHSPNADADFAASLEGALTKASLPFAPKIHTLLVDNCSSCHRLGGFTEYAAMDDADAHYDEVLTFINQAEPAASALLTKAMGSGHQGGTILAAESAELALLLQWIDGGAVARANPLEEQRLKDGDDARADDGATSSEQLPGLAALSGKKAAPHGAVTGAPAGSAGGLRLPGLLNDFRLHGRFDLNYERRDYSGNPFGQGNNALRSYHHFLFLTRDAEDDPFSFDVELTSLQFWEAAYLHKGDGGRWQAGVKLGKLLVPFGPDPLYHSSYGGLAGFDQRILPVIWAQLGVAANARAQWGSVSLLADTYVVRGHALREADSVLNLQSDFSPTEDIQFGMGNRLGVTYGPLSAWYSAYYNPLGFGRRLFMQALDVALWRPPDVPFLQDVSLSAGVLRADVSGGNEGVGGPGDDYYHFGSYFQVRYYPIRGIYIQYRQGLRTFDNRGELYMDPRRFTKRDGSTQSIGVVGHYRGVMVGMWHFWNFEKVDEIDDDFFRFTVAYAF